MINSIDQHVITGNRCFHNKQYFRSYSHPKNHKEKPTTIRRMICRIHDVFQNPSTYVKSLFKTSSRHKRSERMEGMSLIVSSMADHYNMELGFVGFINHLGEEIGHSIEKLAQISGLGLKRASRAMKDLKDVGFITIQQRRVLNKNGQFVSHVSKKTISYKFLSLLGEDIVKSIKDFKDRSMKMVKRDEKKAKRQQPKPASNIMSKIPLTNTGIRNINGNYRSKDIRSESEKKTEIELAMILYEQDQSKSLSEHLVSIRSQRNQS